MLEYSCWALTLPQCNVDRLQEFTFDNSVDKNESPKQTKYIVKSVPDNFLSGDDILQQVNDTITRVDNLIAMETDETY